MERAINILVVDDDELELHKVRRAFARAHLERPLHLALGGRQALDMLRRGDVPGPRRLVLCDVNMPRMDGLEFLRELRADPELRATPVIMLTSSSAEADRAAAYELNAAGYVIKPDGFAPLVDCLTALMRYWRLMELPAGRRSA